MPCGTNNAKSKLESQISELTAKHMHKQIKDILQLIENNNNNNETISVEDDENMLC